MAQRRWKEMEGPVTMWEACALRSNDYEHHQREWNRKMLWNRDILLMILWKFNFAKTYVQVHLPLCFESSWSAFAQTLADTPELTSTWVVWLSGLLSIKNNTTLLYAQTPSDLPLGGVPSQAGLHILWHEVTLQQRQSKIRPHGKLHGTASIQ